MRRSVRLYLDRRSRHAGLILGPLQVVWAWPLAGICWRGAQPWYWAATGPGLVYVRLGPLGLVWLDLERRYG